MMWMNNLKIRTKLLAGFGLVIALTLALAVIGLVQLTNVDSNYDSLLDNAVARGQAITEAGWHYTQCRHIVTNAVLETGNKNALAKMQDDYTKEKGLLHSALDRYIDALESDATLDKATIDIRKKAVDVVRSSLNNEFNVSVGEIFRHAESGVASAARNALSSAAATAGDINQTFEELIAHSQDMTATIRSATTQAATNARLILIIISIAIVLLALISAVFIASAITKGIGAVADAAQKISEGNFDVSVGSNNKDEIGGLSNNLANLKATVEKLVRDIKQVSGDFSAGDIEARINTDSYQGEFQAVAGGFNSTVEGLINDTLFVMDVVTAFGNGDFNISIKQFAGKKADITTSCKAVQANLQKFSSDIGDIITGATNGNLDVSMETTQYKGDWSKMATGINGLLSAVVQPIREAIEVLNELANGNLDTSVKGNYKGEFASMKSALNNTLSMLASYIKEISMVLTSLSRNDLDQNVVREYIGQFSEIKDALNSITGKFNQVVSDIYVASSQVSVGAKQISQSSMTLAQGASEQAASVEELNATVLTIDESTSQNAKNAKDAERLASGSKNNAAKGNQDMDNMLAAMGGINDSSNSISKIIKTIDDIAFQTNLLALNAAVEAARAGIHGKGFAVVAEEVRNLAGKSQQAAKETAELIEESINRVNEGTKIAEQTANALRTIIDDVEKVADIISNIAVASNEQSLAVSQVTEGLSQITEVVQSNSATSEESASAAQELSSQAEVMQNLVSVFKLKKSFH